MRTQEKLIYTNERGESIEFSPASSYHVNFKDVTGLSDVRNAIYSTNSMGQDGDTYLGYRIESRDIDIVGYIKERDKQAAQNLRRKLNRILNPQYEATLTYVFGDFRRVISEFSGDADDRRDAVGPSASSGLSPVASVLSGPVSRYMTKAPKFVYEDAYAADLLKIFEKKSIDDLPVCDRDGRVMGLVDIQDLPKMKVM